MDTPPNDGAEKYMRWELCSWFWCRYRMSTRRRLRRFRTGASVHWSERPESSSRCGLPRWHCLCGSTLNQGCFARWLSTSCSSVVYRRCYLMVIRYYASTDTTYLPTSSKSRISRSALNSTWVICCSATVFVVRTSYRLQRLQENAFGCLSMR
jgi:hypothetical protein